jgi:hypothetical protein
MLLCLWKGCEFASEHMAAFQEHVIAKHVHQQPQQNLDNKIDVGMKEEEMVEQTQIPKLNLDENKMIKKGGGQR